MADDGHPFLRRPVPAGNLGIHWFEQSSLAIKLPGGALIQVDPYFPRDRPADRFIHPRSPLDEASLATQVVLLTHSHGDHTHPETLQRLLSANPDCLAIGPPEALQVVSETVPGARTQEISAGGQTIAAGLEVHAVYAKPPEGDAAARITPPDVTHLGYVLVAEGVRVYVSGDPINTFADHPALVGSVRTLAPQLGFLTCHPVEGEFPFFEGCARMAAAVGLRHAVPVHRDCFVKRTFDPAPWAAVVGEHGIQTILMPRDSAITYPRLEAALS